MLKNDGDIPFFSNALPRFRSVLAQAVGLLTLRFFYSTLIGLVYTNFPFLQTANYNKYI